MDNDFLDQVINNISTKGWPNTDVLEAEYKDGKTIFKFKDAIQYLLENNYLTSSPDGSQTRLKVSPKGQKLILEGGFVGESTYKSDTLKYTKESRDYARKAYCIAILGIIVSIVLFILSKI